MESVTRLLGWLMTMILIFILSSCSVSKGMEVYTSPDLVPGAHATIRISGNATLNPSSVAALTEILHTLESIKALRMNEFEVLKLKQNKTGNGSISDYISNIDHGMDHMEPIKKTYGYKVTVYKQPFGAEKPVVYKQDIEVDDHDVAMSNIYSDDLEYAESQNKEKKTPKTQQLKHFSRQRQGARAFDKGHRNRQKTVKAHEHENYSNKKSNKFHKVTDIVQNKDVKERERESGTKHAVKEKTEIEYYEKEKFVDTELPKSPHSYRVAPTVNAYTPSDLLGGQGSYSHAVYQIPEMATDASYLSMVPYSYYKNPAPSSGGLTKSPPRTYHYHHHHHHGGKQHGSNVRGGRHQHNHHHHPRPPKHYYSSEDLDAGHIWEGFRERGYKITSQREFIVTDRIKKKEYGEKEAAIKTFKTSSDYKKSVKDEREKEYYKKLKDSVVKASGYTRSRGRGQFGKTKEFLHGSDNKNHESFAKTNNSDKIRHSGTEFGSRFKLPGQDKSFNSSNLTGQPSIAEIIKVSIQQAVNRSRKRESYGSNEMTQNLKSKDKDQLFKIPASNDTRNRTFYSTDERPYPLASYSDQTTTRRHVIPKNQDRSEPDQRHRQVLQRPQSRRVSAVLTRPAKTPTEEPMNSDHTTLSQKTKRKMESSEDYFSPLLEYPSLSTAPAPTSSFFFSRHSEPSDPAILFRDKTTKPKILLPHEAKVQ